MDLKSKIFLGFVVDNQDPNRLGRCRVRVINLHDHKNVDGQYSIPTEDVPWASPWKDLNGNVFNLPERGKIVSVVFDNGDPYCPEYIYAEHYNHSLYTKLQQLSDDEYLSMKSLLFDLKTQIYVNDTVGLKIEHLMNNVNIEESSISLNLKDNDKNLNLGDACASQQIILGNHFLQFFEQLLTDMATPGFFAWAGPAGPNQPGPSIAKALTEFKAKRDTLFLSKHVRAVDNDAVKKVYNTINTFPERRINVGVLGDLWMKFGKLNEFAKILQGLSLPKRGKKKRFDSKYKPPQETNPVAPTTQSPVPSPNPNAQSGTSGPVVTDVNSPSNYLDPNRIIEYYEDDDEIGKIVRFLEFKTAKSPVTLREEDYIVNEDPFMLNIVCFRNKLHEFGTITNRFDDQMCVFFKDANDEWGDIRKYSITTVPGYKIVDGKRTDPPVLPEGACFINYGQYVNSFKLGYHNPEVYGNRHPALIGDRVGIRVNKKKGKFEKERYVNTTSLTQRGPDIDGWVFNSGINIHLAMSVDESLNGSERYPRAGVVYEEVNNWSYGCIVFNNPESYREFIGLCEDQIKKTNKNQFTVTVSSAREFEVFETADDFLPDSPIDLDDNIEDRFPGTSDVD